ncbi:MAG: hypothetical protein EBX09_06990, partial [Actinobacteria bacterium]|nr:hypothetical protein [Actinomycetota bacterium]
MCSGSTLQLSATDVPGANYVWVGPNGYTSSSRVVNVPNVDITNAGAYYVSVTSGGCPSDAVYTAVRITQFGTSIRAVTNSPICVNGVLQLSTPYVNGYTYRWDGPQGWSSVGNYDRVNYAQVTDAGIYTLTVNSIACGSVSIATSVVVNSPMINSVITSNSPVCAGGELRLSVPYQNNASYLWNGPNGLTYNTNIPVIPYATTADSGIYSVLISVPGCGSSVSLWDNFIVNQPITWNQPVIPPYCSGSSIVINNPFSPGGCSYTWLGPNGYTTSVRNLTLENSTPAQSGTYTMRTFVPGCPVSNIEFPVVINPRPTIYNTPTFNTPVCQGSTLTGSVIPYAGTGVTYVWNGPGGFSTSGGNTFSFPNVTVANAGNYTYYATIPGCGLYSARAAVSVNNPNMLTAPATSNICAGTTLSVTPSPNYAGVTWRWYGPNGFNSTSRALS